MGRRSRRAGAAFLLFLFGFALSATTFFAAPAPANAQFVDPVTSVQTTTTNVWSTLKDAFVEGAVSALYNGVNYFTSQIAYTLAVSLTTDCGGNIVCWNSKEWDKGFEDAWKGAIASGISTLSDQGGFTALGFDLCAPNLNATLNLQLGLMQEVKPTPPRCNFDDIAKNYKNIAESASSGELLKSLKPTFSQGQSPVSAQLGVLGGKIGLQANAKLDQMMNRLMSAGAGGFQCVTDKISGRCTAPGAVPLEQYRSSTYMRDMVRTQSATGITTGQIASRAVVGIVVNFISTFVQTFVARLWNRLVQGLLSAEELIAIQPDLVLNPEGLLVELSPEEAAAIQAPRYTAPAPKDVGAYDPVLEFTVCPGRNRTQYNCVMDQQFANAVRVADATPFTVRDAIDKGYLHGDWPLIPSADAVKDQDNFCYTFGYCESNLKKLRAARVLPIGWEIAASRSPAGNPLTLKQALDRFDDCNAQGQMDADHPLCHLIDPDWVLKIPPTQCRALAYGDQLLSPDIAARAEVCVDQQTCLEQDDQGNCIGGYGYCARERSVWRFNGDSCPAAMNTCRTLTQRGGNTKNYILNTIEHGICSADNVGCARYAVRRNVASCNSNFCQSGANKGKQCTVLTAVADCGGGVTCGTTCPLNGGCLCRQTVGTCTVLKEQTSCTDGVTNEVCYLGGRCGDPLGCSCTVDRECRVALNQRTCVSTSGSDAEDGDDWLIDPGLFLNKNAQACDGAEDGCTQVIRLDAGQSLNLVRNGSFEELEDGDNDGTPDHAKFWTPFGKAPSGQPGSLSLDGSKAMSGANAARVRDRTIVANSGTVMCTLVAACTNPLGCTCPAAPALSDYTCLVSMGQTDCMATPRVMQVDLPTFTNTTYTLSATFLPVGATLPATAGGILRLRFYDFLNRPVRLSASAPDDVVSTVQFTGYSDDPATPTPDIDDYSCDVFNGNLVFSFEDATGPGARGLTGACTFVVTKEIRHATLEIAGLTGADSYVDNIQLEEGGGTAFHEGYGSAGAAANIKAPPEWLKCTGEENEPEICSQYAGVCRENEVGCDRFTPVNGDPPVPGIATPIDQCPAECAGYDVFKQEASDFDDVKFPVYFIPRTARECSESLVGCSEFTNVQTEAIEYYSKLRLCQAPSDPSTATFYSWEGSDTTGFQLRVWSLKRTTTAAGAFSGTTADVTSRERCCTNGSCIACSTISLATPAETAAERTRQASDLGATGYCVGGANSGLACGSPVNCPGGACDLDAANMAPCTRLDGNAQHCASWNNSIPPTADSEAGLCSRADIDAGDLDCREFYDADGNRHYRKLSKTIIATATCNPYRITVSTQPDCEKSNGRWDPDRGQCVYNADSSLSTFCPRDFNGCRAYKGNASTNIRNVFLDDFEADLANWNSNDSGGTTGLTQSSESVTVGGHSLKIQSSTAAGRQARREVGGLVAPSRSYTLSFWARGSGALNVGLDQSNQAIACALNCPMGGGDCICSTDNGLICAVPPGGTGCTVTKGTYGMGLGPVPATAGPPPAGTASLNFSDDDETAGKCSNNGAACVGQADCTAPATCLRTTAPRINLTSEWKLYSVGPVSVAPSPLDTIAQPPSVFPNGRPWGQFSVKLNFQTKGFCSGATTTPFKACANAGECGGGTCSAPSDIYIDNVQLRAVQDSIFIVRDSWNTPAVCDQTPAGLPSPQEMLGCKEYTDSLGQLRYLRSFSRLCRERSVGCGAFSMSQNTPDAAHEQSFQAVCRLTEDDNVTPRKCGLVTVTLPPGPACALVNGCPRSRPIDGVTYNCTVPAGGFSCDVPIAADQGSNCICDYNGAHPVASGVCSVAGSTSDDGRACINNQQCGDSICQYFGVGVCNGGSNGGNSCASNAQCPGSACNIVGAGNVAPVKLADVCRVSIGESDCRFNYDGWDDSTRPDEHPDRVLIPADKRRYLVVRPDSFCANEFLGCKVVGKAHEAFEGECKVLDPITGAPQVCNAKKCTIGGNSCTGISDCATNTCTGPEGNRTCNITGGPCLTTDQCPQNVCGASTCRCGPVQNAYCDIPFGAGSCIASFEGSIIDKWDEKGIKDLPAEYDKTLCGVNAVGCDEFSTSDGTFYFKDPFDRVCEYKEGIAINGQIRSGWFRRSSSGGNFPCYPELLQQGEYFSMYKNADPKCVLPTSMPDGGDIGSAPDVVNGVCQVVGGCLCFNPPSPIPVCKVVNGATTCGYQGWVGICDPKYDRCEEFVDPANTSAAHPAGLPYYYIINQKLDLGSCSGGASLVQGCVLFDKTSDTAKLYSSSVTYLRSEKDARGNKVSPVNCNLTPHDPRCETRCFSIPDGVCTSDTALQCHNDLECRRCSTTKSKICAGDSECPTGETCPALGGATCDGKRRYTIACDQTLDCNRSIGELCAAVSKCSGSDKICDTNADCSGAGTCVAQPGKQLIPAAEAALTRNDSNIVIKVRPDRECAEWLSCKSFEVIWDDRQSKFRPICSGFGLCTENKQFGNLFECVRSATAQPELLSKELYAKRDTTYSGLEYSGYSLWGRYPMEFLVPIKIVGGRCHTPVDAAVDMDGNPANGFQFQFCNDSTECTAPNFCKQLSGICRAAGPKTGQSCKDNDDCRGAGGPVPPDSINGFCSTNFLTTHRYAVQLEPRRTCTAPTAPLPSGECPFNGACFQHKCLYNFNGGPFTPGNKEWAPRCRAYPENDSPYSESVLDFLSGGGSVYNLWGDGVNKKPGYEAANVCGRGNDCMCHYSRWQYGKGQALLRFHSLPETGNNGYIAFGGADTAAVPDGNAVVNLQIPRVDGGGENTGACVGGSNEGRICNPRRKVVAHRTCSGGANAGRNCDVAGDCPGGSCPGTVYDPCGQEDGGKCQPVTSVSLVKGWDGFCVDLDKSLNINGSQDEFACNLWLPVDRLAGGTDNWNAFEEAGFRPPNPQLLYCQVAQGTRKNDDYRYQFKSAEGGWSGLTPCCNSSPCTSFDACTAYAYGNPVCAGICIAGGPINPACYYCALGACSINPLCDNGPDTISNEVPGDAWFGINWEDYRERSYSYAGENVYKGDMVAIEIHTRSTEGDNTFGKPVVFYLHEGNGWLNQLKWDGNSDVNDNLQGPEVTNSQNTHVIAWGSGESDKCAIWVDDDHENESECEGWGDDHNCLAAKALFDTNGKLTTIKTNLCHNASTFYHDQPVLGAWFMFREQCTDIALVHDDSKFVKNAAYTDRLYQAQRQNEADAEHDWRDQGGVGFWYLFAQDRPQTYDTDGLVPFGPVNPEGMYYAGGGSPKLIVRYPIALWKPSPTDHNTYWNDPGGQSAGPTHIRIDDTGTGGTPNLAGLDPEIGGGSGSFPDVGGQPWACIGSCFSPVSGVSSVGGGNSSSANLNTAYTAGSQKLSQYFATEYFHFRYDPYADPGRDLNVDNVDNDGIYQDFDPTATWDFRHERADYNKQPVVVKVNTGVCSSAEENLCEEIAASPGGGGLTVNDDFDGELDAVITTPRYRAVLKYYAYADKDQMPLRRRVVDFGDGTVVVTKGAYKNHRGCRPGSGCNEPADKWCGYDDPAAPAWPPWGLTEQSCDSRYFQDIHTYVCTPDLISAPEPVGLPACLPGEDKQYPCKAAGKCVFRPRVQFLDNWGLCNGTCPGEPGVGGSHTVCFARPHLRDADLDGPEYTGNVPAPSSQSYSECHVLKDPHWEIPNPANAAFGSKQPWTAGPEIKVPPE